MEVEGNMGIFSKSEKEMACGPYALKGDEFEGIKGVGPYAEKAKTIERELREGRTP